MGDTNKQQNAEKNFENKKIHSYAVFTPLAYLVAIFIFYRVILGNQIMEGKLDAEMLGGKVTVVFTGVMLGVIILEALCCRRRLISISKALSNENKLQNSFGNKFIISLIKKYNDANAKIVSKRKNAVARDISEFINIDMILDAANVSFSEQTGNILTGLGILGTFVGLTIGLEKFNSQDAFGGTAILLNGIKVAFYTSIFGVTGSLIFNIFFQKDVEACECALSKFYEQFYSEQPLPQQDYYNKMICLNEKQTVALETLAGSIAGRLEEKLPEKLAEAVDKCIKPTMEELKKSIYDNIMKSVDAQSETLGKLVDKFMKQLNESLDDQFYNLAKSINEMCNWQGDLTEKLKSIMESLDETAGNVSKLCVDTEQAEKSRRAINDSTVNMLDKTKRYVDSFEHYTETIHEWTEEIASYQMPLMEQKKLLDGVIEKNEALNVEIKRLNGDLDKFQKKTDEMQFKQNETNDAIQSAANDIRNTANNLLDKTNNKMQEISNNIRESTESYKKSVQEVKEDVTKSTQALKDSIKNAEDEVKKISDVVTEKSKFSADVTNAVGNVLSKKMDKISAELDQNTEKIIEVNKANRRFALFARHDENE